MGNSDNQTAMNDKGSKSTCLSWWRARDWLFVLLLLFGMVFDGVVQAAALRVGVYAQVPPKSFIDENGKLAGFDIDFARALCARIHRQCELVQSEWDELIQGLIANRIDMVVASMSITEERSRLIDFTRPYYDSPARLVARDGRFISLDPKTLQDVSVGVLQGTTFSLPICTNLRVSSCI